MQRQISCRQKSIKERRKMKRGGLAFFVNDTLCNPGNNSLIIAMWSKCGKLPVVGLRPYYVPREFRQAKILQFIGHEWPTLCWWNAETETINLIIILITMFHWCDFTFTNAPRESKTLDILHANGKDTCKHNTVFRNIWSHTVSKINSLYSSYPLPPGWGGQRRLRNWFRLPGCGENLAQVVDIEPSHHRTFN